MPKTTDDPTPETEAATQATPIDEATTAMLREALEEDARAKKARTKKDGWTSTPVPWMVSAEQYGVRRAWYEIRRDFLAGEFDYLFSFDIEDRYGLRSLVYRAEGLPIINIDIRTMELGNDMTQLPGKLLKAQHKTMVRLNDGEDAGWFLRRFDGYVDDTGNHMGFREYALEAFPDKVSDLTQVPLESPKAKSGKPRGKRGRRPAAPSQQKTDKEIYDAHTKFGTSFSELAYAKGVTKKCVELACDRHRKRLSKGVE